MMVLATAQELAYKGIATSHQNSDLCIKVIDTAEEAKIALKIYSEVSIDQQLNPFLS